MTDEPGTKQPGAKAPGSASAAVARLGKAVMRRFGWKCRLLLALIVVIGAGLIALLGAVTVFGKATRAAAEDELAALLVGLRPHRIALTNWVHRRKIRRRSRFMAGRRNYDASRRLCIQRSRIATCGNARAGRPFDF